MRIYFSPANTADVDQFGDEGLFTVGVNEDKQYFYQAVEFGTNAGGLEEVRIFDTCNRSIPIAVETIPQLVEALNHCYNMETRFRRVQEEMDRAETDRVAVVESTWYDEEHEVVYID